MKLAAAAVLVNTKPTVAEGVAVLEALIKDPSSDRERKTSSWLSGPAIRCRQNFGGLFNVSSALLKRGAK